MEAIKLQTVADLLVHPDERVELIGGEILRRPMARFVHGRAQGCTFRQLGFLKRHRVPWYWLIWPETRTLVAYAMRDGE